MINANYALEGIDWSNFLPAGFDTSFAATIPPTQSSAASTGNTNIILWEDDPTVEIAQGAWVELYPGGHNYQTFMYLSDEQVTQLDFMAYLESGQLEAGVSFEAYQAYVSGERASQINSNIEYEQSLGAYRSPGGVGGFHGYSGGNWGRYTQGAFAQADRAYREAGEPGYWLPVGGTVTYEDGTTYSGSRLRWVPLTNGPWSVAGGARAGEGSEWGYYPVGTQYTPPIELARIAAQIAMERRANSIDNARIGYQGEVAARMYLTDVRGMEVIGEQVRVVIYDKDKRPNLRIYDFVAIDRTGNILFLEVKTGLATRDKRQLDLDKILEKDGAIWGTGRVEGYNKGGVIGRMTVEEINIGWPEGM